MRRAFWKRCERKKAFYTSHHANKVGRLRGQRAYQCDSCRRWHLASA